MATHDDDNHSHSHRARRALSLAKRYGRTADGEEGGQGDALWNEVLQTLLARRSTRAFLPTPVSEEHLELMVAAAQSASTSSNLQVWSVVAVQDRERIARIAAVSGQQRHVLNAPLLLVFISDLSRLRALGGHTGIAVEALDYFESFVVSITDATLAAQNAVVAASSLGLGTCFIGALRNQPVEIAAELQLPPESFAVFGLVVGHPDPARASDVKPRLPAEVVLHREQYAAFDATAFHAYDAVMDSFQTQQGMASGAWSEKSAERVSGPDSLKGRDLLLEAIRARGFVLK